MTSNSSHVPGPIELRASEIEAAVECTAALQRGADRRNLDPASADADGPRDQCAGVAHPSDLCAYVAQSVASTTRVADGLRERGLITRVASEEDRRLQRHAAGGAARRARRPARMNSGTPPAWL